MPKRDCKCTGCVNSMQKQKLTFCLIGYSLNLQPKAWMSAATQWKVLIFLPEIKQYLKAIGNEDNKLMLSWIMNPLLVYPFQLFCVFHFYYLDIWLSGYPVPIILYLGFLLISMYYTI